MISIRWPEPFWEAVSAALRKRRISMQAFVTDLVAGELGLPSPIDEGDDGKQLPPAA